MAINVVIMKLMKAGQPAGAQWPWRNGSMWPEIHNVCGESENNENQSMWRSNVEENVMSI
jgi:hypothetical protein